MYITSVVRGLLEVREENIEEKDSAVVVVGTGERTEIGLWSENSDAM